MRDCFYAMTRVAANAPKESTTQYLSLVHCVVVGTFTVVGKVR